MKRWIVCLCLFGTLVVVAPGFGQSGHITESLGKMEMAKHPLELEPPAGPQPHKLDTEKIRSEADELAKLANSMPTDVAQILQGKLPKDTADKLKRIEKLSKHLRGELNP